MPTLSTVGAETTALLVGPTMTRFEAGLAQTQSTDRRAKTEIEGENGWDTIYGGSDDDWIDAGNGLDTVYGGSGDDTIYGRGKPDTIFGGSGDDTIYGNNDGDTINGGDDQDECIGGKGIDVFVQCEVETP